MTATPAIPERPAAHPPIASTAHPPVSIARNNGDSSVDAWQQAPWPHAVFFSDETATIPEFTGRPFEIQSFLNMCPATRIRAINITDCELKRRVSLGDVQEFLTN